MGTTAGGSSWTQLWGAWGSQDVAVGCCKEQGVCPWAAHPCGRAIAIAAELLPFLLLQNNAFSLPASYQPHTPSTLCPLFFSSPLPRQPPVPVFPFGCQRFCQLYPKMGHGHGRQRYLNLLPTHFLSGLKMFQSFPTSISILIVILL